MARAKGERLPQPADQAGRLLLPAQMEADHLLPPMVSSEQLEPDGAALLIDEAQLDHRPRVGFTAQAVWGPVDRVMSHEAAAPDHDRPRILPAPRVLDGGELCARHFDQSTVPTTLPAHCVEL